MHSRNRYLGVGRFVNARRFFELHMVHTTGHRLLPLDLIDGEVEYTFCHFTVKSGWQTSHGHNR